MFSFFSFFLLFFDDTFCEGMYTQDFACRFLALFYSLFITGIDDIFVSQNANVFIEYDISTKSE